MYRVDISMKEKSALRPRLAPGGRVAGRDELPARDPAWARARERTWPGHVDYRLARNVVVSEFRKGRLSRLDVCDAHPELLRAAANVGEETREDCPICEEVKVRLVSYAFGTGLPPSGTCITSKGELHEADPAGPERHLLRGRGVPELLVEPPGPQLRRRRPVSRRLRSPG